MGSKKAKPTVINNTSTNAPPPEVMAEYQKLMGRANEVASTPYQAFGGQLSAGMNDTQRGATANINNAVNNAWGIDETIGRVLGYTGDVHNQFSRYSDKAGTIGQDFAGLSGQAGLIGADMAANSNVWQPYFDQANAATGLGATAYMPTAFSGAEVERYMSPYTQNVIDTTLANIRRNDGIQQQGIITSAIKQGNAFGGDRMGLAQAELGRGQSMASGQVIAGLTDQNYRQALDMFNKQQQIDLSANQNNAARSLQAGAQFGQLGQGAQSAALAGSDAQLRALAAQGQLTGQQLAALTAQGQLSQGQLAALGLQGTLTAQRTANNNSAGDLATKALAAGTLEQQTEQQRLDREQNAWREEISFPYQQTGWLGNMVLGIGSNSGGTSTGTSTQTGGSSGSNGVGTAIGAGLSLLSKLPFSDERVKEDVRKIGETYDGQPLYSFRYKGDPITHVGLMAQEVERKTPEAVFDVDGVKRVDYRAATEDAADRGKFALGGSVPGMPVTSLIPELNLPMGRTMPSATAPSISGSQQQSSSAQDLKDIGAGAGDLLKKSGLFSGTSPLSLTGDTASSAVGSVSAPIATGLMGGFGGLFAFGGEVEDPGLPSFADPTVVGPDVLEALRAAREADNAPPLPPVRPAGLGSAIVTGEPASGLAARPANDDALLRPAASAEAAYTGFNAGNRPSDARPASAGNSPFASLFERKASEHGVSPRFLDRTANIETGGRYDPAARNPSSSAGGLFQFINDTAGRMGLADRFDPEQATDAAARLARENAAVLRRTLGRDPTDSELYLAHQQGAAGASKILTNPDAPMESLVGQEAARLNGGAGLTAAQFAAKYNARFEGAPSSASAFARQQPGLGNAAAVRAITGGLRNPAAGLSGATMDQPSVQPAAEDKGLFGTGFKLSDEARDGLFAAGLAMMARSGTTRNLGQIIGEGGLAGLSTYQKAKAGTLDGQKTALEMENLRAKTEGSRIDTTLKARQLDETLKAMRADAAITSRPAVTPAPVADALTAPLRQIPSAAPMPITPAQPQATDAPPAAAPEAPALPIETPAQAPAPAAAAPATPARAAVAESRVAEFPDLAPDNDPRVLEQRAQAWDIADPARAKSFRDRAASVLSAGKALDRQGRLVALPDVTADPLDKEGKRLDIETKRRNLDGKGFRSLITPDDRAKAGVDPSYKGTVQIDRDGQLHYPGKAATEINIDKGANEFAKKANEIAAKRYETMVTAADEAIPMRADVETLAELLEGVGTGAGAETRVGIANMAKSMGLDSIADKLTGGKLDEMQAAQALLDKLTPRMRVPGSGTSSDRDMAAFKNSLPSLGKQPGGNKMIADTFRSIADYQATIGDIASQALRNEIEQKDADRMIREVPSPFVMFKEFQKAGGKPKAEAAKPEAKAQPEKAKDMPEIARPASKAEFDALKPGTKFVDPNGDERVKP